jgi:hypothetical protein
MRGRDVPRELTRPEVVDILARMMRDEAYPEFRLAPPPAWATRAAERIIDYHQPMLRDVLLQEAKREAVAAYIRARAAT